MQSQPQSQPMSTPGKRTVSLAIALILLVVGIGAGAGVTYVGLLTGGQINSGLCSSGRTLTLGVLTDLSSDLASQGTRAADAAKLAVTDINSYLSTPQGAATSGTSACNVKFAVSVSDYALDGSKALTELQAFAAAGVQVVIGPLNSGAAQNILQYANTNHIVLISPSSTSVALAIPNDYLFRTAPNDRWQGQGDSAMLKAEGASKVIILQRHDTYGDALANATAVNFAGSGNIQYGTCTASDTVCILRYDTSLKTFGSIIPTLTSDYTTLNSGSNSGKVAIDAISFEEFGEIVIEISQSTDTATKALLTTDMLPGVGSSGPVHIWTGTDGQAQDTILSSNSTSGPILSSIRLPSTIYGFQNDTKTITLQKNFAGNYTNVVCDNYCRGTYDDVWLAALATLNAGSYDGTKIQAVMLGVASSYYGVTGPDGLEASGDRIATIYQIWKVTTPSGGTPTWVYGGYWDATSNTLVGFNPY
jgi:branched-chain amino acid transport system substrate-binding protein